MTLSKTPFKNFQSQNFELAQSLAQTVQSARQTFESIWGSSCTSIQDSFCGFLETLKDVSKQGEDQLVNILATWDDVSQQSYKYYADNVKAVLIQYYTRYEHLMSNKMVNCYLTSLRKEMDSHKVETKELIVKSYADSLDSFTNQVAQFRTNIDNYSAIAVKVVQKCSARESPRECANNFVDKASGLTAEYQGVINQILSLTQKQLMEAGPSTDEVLEQVESKDDEFEVVLQACQ